MSEDSTTQSVEVLGQELVRGREFRVKGSRTRFKFLRYVEAGDLGCWIEAIGSRGEFRAFGLDAVEKVFPVPRR